jgi:hypothetical protein
MYKYLKLLAFFFVIFNSSTLLAEPFLSPHSPFMRHEIRLLQDYGFINSNINTWPLNLGGMNSGNAKGNWTHDLLGGKLKSESRSGWASTKSKISISDNHFISRSFGNDPRGGFSTGFETSWMNDRFAAKLSLLALYDVKNDWKGRKDEGIKLDGSYIAARLGNWSASLGQVDRWWGPGWDGSLILSNNARPMPAISLDRRIAEPFDNKWLSWIGPWSFHSFIGQMEKERTVPNPYLWGMRVEFAPAVVKGLEVGLFRVMQLGGDGRPEGFSTWVDAFLSQDNYGANTGLNNRSDEPGNQLAGIDFRWKVLDSPFAIYGQLVGEDEDKFLPNCLIFQYGVEAWKDFSSGTGRLFFEYADLTSTWWTDDDRRYNITYNHHIYNDGYRYKGRSVGHWADTDSQIFSLGGLFQYNSGIGWGGIFRSGHLNEDNSGNNSVSNGASSDYFSIEVFNNRSYPRLDLEVQTSLGWEDIKDSVSTNSESGLTFSASLTKLF